MPPGGGPVVFCCQLEFARSSTSCHIPSDGFFGRVWVGASTGLAALHTVVLTPGRLWADCVCTNAVRPAATSATTPAATRTVRTRWLVPLGENSALRNLVSRNTASPA